MPSARDTRRYWVWITGPDYYLEDDGSERADLDPGQGYEPGGWWTCHRETEEGDLVLLYRSRRKQDLAYLIETRSDAYSLLDERTRGRARLGLRLRLRGHREIPPAPQPH